MPVSLLTTKLAVLGLAALVKSTKLVQQHGGSALPLREIIEFAFGQYDVSKRRRLRELSQCIASDLNVFLPSDEGTREAILLTTEDLLTTFGLSDEEFAALGLNAREAASAVLKRHTFSTPSERLELEEKVSRVLLCMFYDRLPKHPDLFQELLPNVHRSLFNTIDESMTEIKIKLQEMHNERRLDNKEAHSRTASPDFGIPDLDDDDFYIAKCPASLEEYDQTAELARDFFATGELINLEADRNAFKHNPYSMVVLLDKRKEVVGFVDIYHLPDHKLDEILNDNTGTAFIDPRDCLLYDEARQVKRAYIATIMVRREKGISAARRLAALVYGMSEFLLKHQFHNTDELVIWSIGSTKPGKAILKRLGFTYDHLVQWEPSNADEKRGVYRMCLNKEDLLIAQSNFFAKYDLRNVQLEIKDHLKNLT